MSSPQVSDTDVGNMVKIFVCLAIIVPPLLYAWWMGVDDVKNDDIVLILVIVAGILAAISGILMYAGYYTAAAVGFGIAVLTHMIVCGVTQLKITAPNKRTSDSQDTIVVYSVLGLMTTLISILLVCFASGTAHAYSLLESDINMPSDMTKLQ